MKFKAKGFYKLAPKDRIERIKTFRNLKDEDLSPLNGNGLKLEQANNMIENVIGTLEMPVGLGVYFYINEKEYIVPMSLEEPSVVAAASKMAKIAKIKGGFITSSTPPIMIGQIQITNVKDPFGAKMRILSKEKELLELANEQDPLLVKLGGGARELEVKILNTEQGSMVICEISVDCRDAMGANAVNTMAEAIAPKLEEIAKGKVFLRILSNLAVKRLARAYAVFEKDSIGGEDVVDGIISAYQFAKFDPFRATTHNKGIMNGISSVALATGQDTRALEAGAHAYAAMKGRYTSLSTWEKNEDGDLVGTLELPMAVGIIGGAVKVNPVVKSNLKILGVKTANELAEIMVAVGLSQNAGALRALADEGIQKGHMSLHARNLVVSAGAPTHLVDIAVEKLVKNGAIRLDIAQEIVNELVTTGNNYSFV